MAISKDFKRIRNVLLVAILITLLLLFGTEDFRTSGLVFFLIGIFSFLVIVTNMFSKPFKVYQYVLVGLIYLTFFVMVNSKLYQNVMIYLVGLEMLLLFGGKLWNRS